MIWPALSLVSRIILCGVFLMAAWPKIASPDDFAMIVYQYQTLPDGLVNLVALLLPWIEAVAAVVLVLSFKTWRRASGILLILLLIFFTTIISIKLYQGVEIHCGCFSTAAAKGAVIGPANLIRNGFLILLAFFALYADHKLTSDVDSRGSSAS